ncbi:alpha-ribazole phosphatase [Pelosinus fermentans JBW45]|uniref:Alpha-ribazole phosphatase n=1 Tax=Pelosinus fermentans JBW45 TaxID=1192197 RepID=I9NT13_9FIRM|nr:alpha-ribazole phosphatase [Pelosinus fermentans JBW45]
MENRTVYLIRHGKIKFEDNQRRYIGQLDLPLSLEGIQQAQCLETILKDIDIGKVYCSDLLRSQQTAQIIAGNKAIPVIVRKDLREIHMGNWEGRTFSHIVKEYPEEFKARGADIGYYRVAGGESFADCYKRVIDAFHEIMNSSSGTILLVGHAGVNRLLLCYVLGMPLANLFRMNQDYGSLNIIATRKSGWQVKLVNETTCRR